MRVTIRAQTGEVICTGVRGVKGQSAQENVTKGICLKALLW